LVVLFRFIVRILIAFAGSILLVVLLLIGLLHWYMTPPSDTALQRRFFEHRADLEQIVKMMEQDVHMVRIAKDFTRKDDNWNSERPKSEWGISEQRWNQYREIFRRADVPIGTQRGEKSNDIEIVAWAAGLSIAGESVSYLRCGKPSAGLVNAYPPCLERKESGRIDENGHLIRYRRIEGDWYIFDDDD
jgi:hypothetical protein